MKFTMEVDSAKNPDAVGEYLRSEFFAIDPNDGWSFGCYSTFDWAAGVEPLDEIHQPEVVCSACQETVESETEGKLEDMFGPQGPEHFRPEELSCCCIDETVWTRGQKSFDTGAVGVYEEAIYITIECRWWWDGDGTLVFSLPGGEFLVNTDCKKNYGWFNTEDPEDF
jgi:hypothetical protein